MSNKSKRLMDDSKIPEVAEGFGELRDVRDAVAVLEGALEGDLEVVERRVDVVVLVEELVGLRDVVLESDLELKETNKGV